MSLPRIAMLPTDAVRQSATVPLGNTRAEEFSIPSRVGRSAVSKTYLPFNERMSLRDSHGTSPPSQYAGIRLLGVCPLSKRATSVSFDQDQPVLRSPLGFVVIGDEGADAIIVA